MVSKISGRNHLITATSTHTAGAISRVVKPERRNSTSYWATASSTLVILLAAINLAGCRQARSQDDPRTLPPLVEIATVQLAYAPQRAFTGVVVARVQSNLGFRVAGKVVRRLVNTGDFVRRGQPLMQIDRTDLALAVAAKKAAVASAEARAIESRADEARYRTLLAAGVTSRQSYDQAKAAADTARAQLHQTEAEAKEANKEAAYSVLDADSNGVVVETQAEPGQVVSAGQTVLKLAHAGPREAAVNLPETLHPALGSMAEATVYDANGTRSPAYLRQLSDAADPQSRTFEARYVLEGPAADARLGSTVTIYLSSADRSRSSKVPLGALCDRGDGPGVWIVDPASSSIVFRPVRIRSLGDEQAIVSSGVEPGDRIVALGAQLLHPGERVRAVSYRASSR